MATRSRRSADRVVVLRRVYPPFASRDPFRGTPVALEHAAGSGQAVVRVELEETDARGYARLAADPSTAAIARAMPMRLITPTDGVLPLAPEPPEAPAVAWGVRAVGADTSPFTGAGIVIGVLDTGIRKAHAAFNGVQIQTKNFTQGPEDDLDGHGTHCAGIIFGRRVSGVRIGVAPGVTRALVAKVLHQDRSTTADVADAIQWAAINGAHVISMSLGVSFTEHVADMQDDGVPPREAMSRALADYRASLHLFERLAELLQVRTGAGQPTLLVAAAGNESARSAQPAFEVGVDLPGAAVGVLSVGALDQGSSGFRLAPFSNTGANVVAPGVGVFSAIPGGLPADTLGRPLTGTSMAAPHVAGVAALWAERIMREGPLTHAALLARLVASAHRHELEPGTDPFDVGEGLVHSPQA